MIAAHWLCGQGFRGRKTDGRQWLFDVGPAPMGMAYGQGTLPWCGLMIPSSYPPIVGPVTCRMCLCCCGNL